jgi:hypothetical protein
MSIFTSIGRKGSSTCARLDHRFLSLCLSRSHRASVSCLCVWHLCLFAVHSSATHARQCESEDNRETNPVCQLIAHLVRTRDVIVKLTNVRATHLFVVDELCCTLVAFDEYSHTHIIGDSAIMRMSRKDAPRHHTHSHQVCSCLSRFGSKTDVQR